MAQVSYGTITITDTNDIESITIEYARNQSTTTPPASSSSDWSSTRPAWAQGYYIWQRTRIHKTGEASTEDTFGDAVCLTGSTGQTGNTGQSLTATKTQYTHVASNVTITTSNHTSYTWTDNVPEYDSTKPVYWGRITNTYSNPSKTEYIVYKDNGLTEAIAKSVEANANASEALGKANEAESIATHANEDAQGAMSQAASNLNSVVRLWYAKSNSTAPAKPTSRVITGSSSTYNAWSTVKPADNSSYQYYFYCNQSCTGGGVYSWSDVVLDTSTLSQYQIGALTAKVKNFWWDSNGAHVASGKNGNEITTNTISTYGYHALMGLTGISFNYDGTKVVDLNSTTPSLDFYQPPTISGSTVTQGKKTMMLSANALRFYNPADGTTEQAVLDTNGLILKKGGVKAGTAGQSGFIYLSTENYGSNLTINSHQASNWREIIGTKFGVDADGNLYASNAEISGKITVTSGSNLSAGLGDYSTTSQTQAYVTGLGYQTSSQVNNIIEGKGYQTSSDVNSAIDTATSRLATKSDAVYRMQRIYYRKTSSEAPSKNTTWLASSGTGYDSWSTKIPQLTNETTKYPYLYTAVQTQTIAQYNGGSGTNCSCSNVLLDDSTTIIDGGNIITGSITANKINVDNLSAISANVGGWHIGDDTNHSLYYLNYIPGFSTENLVLSPTSATNTNSIGGSGTGLSWFISAGQDFGVTTKGGVYASNIVINSTIDNETIQLDGKALQQTYNQVQDFNKFILIQNSNDNNNQSILVHQYFKTINENTIRTGILNDDEGTSLIQMSGEETIKVARINITNDHTLYVEKLKPNNLIFGDLEIIEYNGIALRRRN